MVASNDGNDSNDGKNGNDGNEGNAMMAMMAMDHLGREMSVLGRSATSAATNQIIDLNNSFSFCVRSFLSVFIFVVILLYIFFIVVKVIIFSDKNVIGEEFRSLPSCSLGRGGLFIGENIFVNLFPFVFSKSWF